MQNVNFFKKQGGRWFSQRTTHYLKAGGSKAGKSDLEVTYLEPNAAEIVRLCDQASDQASGSIADAVGGLKIVQKSTIIGGQTQAKSTLLAAIATDDTSGQLLIQPDGKAAAQVSQYQFANDVLTIITEANGLRAEERWWFITERLRMRSNIVSGAEGQTMASFCSEIRLGDASA